MNTLGALHWPWAGACLALLGCAAAHAQPAAYSADDYLRHFALSTCLAKGFAGTALARDAQAAAAAYVELGTYDAEAYAAAAQLANDYLARPYKSKQGQTPLTTMKCIDLMRGPELRSLMESQASPAP
ncbi:type VI secretion protein [Comamonadaceae bacterium OH2310_COT-174]|nr:type VI secretion protein [Comamonadaceae bacterium OH2310_COT-174]